tara:strand:+ start:1169 stop:1702 length:534 start_codon:yes stop_codon:yes gene_type:complete
MNYNIALIKNNNIILDSCTIQYLDNKAMKLSLWKILKHLRQNKNVFNIALISYYELLSECPKNKEEKLLKILGFFNIHKFSEEVIVTAARLATCYRLEPNIKNHQSINDGDKIIAATAMLSDSFILTANANDFPRPFFNEVYKENIIYKKKNKDYLLSMYLLKPDLDLFLERLKRRP